MKRGATTGLTLLELLMVITVGSVLTILAVPVTVNGVRSYQLTAAVSSATGAIQSTRYLAIMHGYPYQITFTPSTNSYQVLNEAPPATSFSNVLSAVPISGPDTVVISRTITMQFSANGTVTEITTPPVGVSSMVFQIANINHTTGLAYATAGWSNTLTVSSVGNVAVTTP
ncbi:MAG: hypothetical protein ACLQVG_06260 [Terriglobia bacterium]